MHCNLCNTEFKGKRKGVKSIAYKYTYRKSIPDTDIDVFNYFCPNCGNLVKTKHFRKKE